MIAQEAIDLSPTAPREAAARPRSSEIPDDKAMLRAAVELTRDISAARPEIYWPDMLASAAVGYGALAGAILMDSPGRRSAVACWRRWDSTERCCSFTS